MAVTTKPKKPINRDEWRWLDRAVSFRVHQRTGPSRFSAESLDVDTLAEAMGVRKILASRGIGSILYAITADGSAWLVPATYTAERPELTKWHETETEARAAGAVIAAQLGADDFVVKRMAGDGGTFSVRLVFSGPRPLYLDDLPALDWR